MILVQIAFWIAIALQLNPDWAQTAGLELGSTADGGAFMDAMTFSGSNREQTKLHQEVGLCL